MTFLRLLISAVVMLMMLSSCASWDASGQEQLLSAAGFSMKQPETAKQQEIYNSMESYKLVSGTVNGRLLFAYKNPKRGMVYVGGEPQYQEYQRLALQRRVAQQNYMAAQMNQQLMMSWGHWGPRGYWW